MIAFLIAFFINVMQSLDLIQTQEHYLHHIKLTENLKHAYLIFINFNVQWVYTFDDL